MPNRKLPQITRFNPARIFEPLLSVVILFLTCLLLYLNLKSVFPINKANSYFRNVLVSPYNLINHIEIGRLFWDNRLIDLAFRELLIADEVSLNSRSYLNASVLGSSTPVLDYLDLWKSEPEKISRHYEYWFNRTLELPDYRDAYLIAGILAGQLGLNEQANSHFRKAKAIDPNHPILNNLTWQD